MLFHLIIKWLSATADGFGRESADRIASRNNTNGIPCNSVFQGKQRNGSSASCGRGAAETYKTELRR